MPNPAKNEYFQAASQFPFKPLRLFHGRQFILTGLREKRPCFMRSAFFFGSKFHRALYRRHLKRICVPVLTIAQGENVITQ
jgi:hypothetical protein